MTDNKSATSKSIPLIDFNGLDTTVHGPVRLGVMTALQIEKSLDFTKLKKRLAVSDGALGLHLQKLEETGYLKCEKKFVGQRPKSTYRLTPLGRKALASYLDAMRAVIDSVQNSTT
jgi:DNA-binding PadR family transcriptional regulator